MHAVHALVGEAVKEYGLSEDLAHWLELTISESMINAIQHGNCCDPEKKATLKISSQDDVLEIIVEDQGKGFARENGVVAAGGFELLFQLPGDVEVVPEFLG